MSFDVAQLNAHLQAEVAGFLRNMEAADASVDSTERHIRHLEAVAKEAGRTLNDVRVTSAQAFESRTALETIERSVGSVSRAALLASDHLQEVKVTEAQALETKIATSEIKTQLDEVIVKAEAARIALHRVNGGAGGGGGGGGGGGLLAGVLPGGARARPAALAALAAAGLSTLPSIAPAGLGLLAGGANAGLGLAGGAGVLFGALHGINAKAFTNQKDFNALDPGQKQLVQDLRSLSAGLGEELQKISQTILPHLSQELHTAFSPTTTAAITADVHAFADATSQVADQWGRFLGGPFGTELGGLLQHDAQYLVPLNDELMNMLDFLVQVLGIGTPFTDWLSHSVQLAAEGANAWAHSADGVQLLGTAFDQAKQGLQSLSDLVGGFLQVLAAIYQATEGGTNPAIEVLAGLLRELATIINDNRETIAHVFEGGVGAVRDLLNLVDALRPVLHAVLTIIDDIAGALGGWNTVIDAAAVFWVARMLAIKLGVDGVLAKILLIGPETASSTAEADAALATLTVAAETAAAALSGIGPAAVEGAAVADGALAGTGVAAGAAAGEVGVLRGALLGLGALGAISIPIIIALAYKSLVGGSDKNAVGVTGAGNVYLDPATGKYVTQGPRGGVIYSDTPPVGVGSVGGTPGVMPAGADRHGAAASRAPVGMTYSQQQIRQLLMANGVPPDVATNLAIISAHGEDPSGNPAALNDNARTGDYSVGLFQENFLGQMGVDRTKKFAPQFGLAPTTPVKEFVKWLGEHPAAQAKIAYQIFQDQGYGAWTTAAGLGITGGAMNPFGTPDPLKQTKVPKKGVPSGLGLLPTDIATSLENAKAAVSAAQAAGNLGSLGGGQPIFVIPGAHPGMTSDGNIDLAHRPVAHNADGSISTVRSISISIDGHEVLIPTVVGGKVVSNAAAIAHYRQTGQNLGSFSSIAAANKYAEALHNEQAKLYAGGGNDAGGTGLLGALQHEVSVAQDALDFLDKQKATGKELVNIARERSALEKEIATATKEIAAAEKLQQQNAMATKERKILGLDASGAAATPSVLSLRSQAKTMASELAKAAGDGLDVTDAQAMLAKLQRVLKFNFIPPDVRQAVANQIAALKQTVSSGMAQLLADAKANLADATSSFESGFSSVLTAADQQFEQNVASASQTLQILVHGPFGDFLFGGKLKMTPAGKALADLQDSHTLQGLQDSLKAAQDAVAKAQGGDGRIFDFATGLTTTIPGDSSSLLNAQQQLADAEFAMKQYELGKQTDAENAAAADQLTAAQDAYTQQQRLVETAMDQQVRAIEAGMESGKISADAGFSEIEKIWSTHGISLEAISFAMGGQIYNGLSQGLSPIFGLLKTLIEDLNKVLGLEGLPQIGDLGSGIPDGVAGLAPIRGHAVPMAGGGYIPPRPGGTLVRAAEAGKGEFFIPEDKMGGGGGGVQVHINGDVYTMDADEFARKITPAIREQLALTNRSTTSLFG